VLAIHIYNVNNFIKRGPIYLGASNNFVWSDHGN